MPNPQNLTRSNKGHWNIAACAEFLALMCERPRSRKELLELTGLAESTVTKWLSVFHRKRLLKITYKRIHQYGPQTPFYSFEYKGFDDPEPKPLTQAEYSKRWRQNKAATQEEKFFKQLREQKAAKV